MVEPGSPLPDGEPEGDAPKGEPTRDPLEQLALAAIGAIALLGQRFEGLAKDFADRGAVRRDEARSLVDEATQRWRGDASRLGERAGGNLSDAFHRIGLVTRDEFEELELRVAQVEHRLRLLEGGGSLPSALTPRD